MTMSLSKDPKEVFYTTLKNNFIKGLAEGGVKISEDVAPEFVQILTKTLHQALDSTFKELGPTLVDKGKDVY